MSERADDIVTAVDSDGVAVVTIDRPAKRNALTLAMWRRLKTLFDDLGARSDVRIIVLTGAGGNFCAGADISEFPKVRNSPESGHIYEAAVDGALIAMRDCKKPTIAAVSGFGLGGGSGIALACDFRTGDATTRMGIPAAKLGNVYGTIESDLLLRQVGLANAKLVLFAGRQIDLAGCLRMNLVDLVGDGTALDTAMELAREMAANAPISLEGSKVILEALVRGEEDERKGDIEHQIKRALSSEDYREAARAFVEKRKPVFTGR